MDTVQKHAEQHIESVLTKIEQLFLQHELVGEGCKDLSVFERGLMKELDQDGFMHECLKKVLSIDYYVTDALSHLDHYNSLLKELQSTVAGMKQHMEKKPQSLPHQYQKVQKKLSKCLQQHPKTLPLNPQQKQPQHIDLLHIETKLTNLLHQHEQQTKHYQQQLQLKEAQLQQMNEEFVYEIQKYNAVYEGMKSRVEVNEHLRRRVAMLERENNWLRECQNGNGYWHTSYHQYHPN